MFQSGVTEAKSVYGGTGRDYTTAGTKERLADSIEGSLIEQPSRERISSLGFEELDYQNSSDKMSPVLM